MSSTSPATLIAVGVNPQQAYQLATEIDATIDSDALEKAAAVRLIGSGFPVPLANELSAQMRAGTGIVANLMGLGVPPPQATAIKTAIDS